MNESELVYGMAPPKGRYGVTLTERTAWNGMKRTALRRTKTVKYGYLQKNSNNI